MKIAKWMMAAALAAGLMFAATGCGVSEEKICDAAKERLTAMFAATGEGMPSALSIEITQKLSDDCWVAVVNATLDDYKSEKSFLVILVITDGELAAIDFPTMSMRMESSVSKSKITLTELKQIALGYCMYGVDHDDQFPDDLNELTGDYYYYPGCDISHYVYVGKGLRLGAMKSPSELPIAFEKPAWIGKDGVCGIAYGDGHCESVPVKGRTCRDIVQELTERVRDEQDVAVVRRNATAEDQAIAKAYEKDANLRLLHAAGRGDADEVEKGLSAGANVNAEKDGWTPLMLAARNGHAEIAKLLIEANADVYAKNQNGFTPLMFAAEDGHAEIVKLLIKAKADVNAKNQNGVTPLMLAAASSHVASVQLLIEAKADVNAKNQNGVTPLMVAAGKGHAEIVKLLIAANADVNAKGNNGWTPLMCAAGNGHAASVQLLIKAKADVNAKNQNGFTPLMLAAMNGHAEIAKLLIKAKADVNAKNKDGETVLAIATNKGLSDVVTLLQNAGAQM